jgi:hypothetical protein
LARAFTAKRTDGLAAPDVVMLRAGNPLLTPPGMRNDLGQLGR